MEKLAFWDRYLISRASHLELKEKYCLYQNTFADHKKCISRLIESIKPSSVAILGSGCLIDIPLADLVAKKRKIYLVDWIKDVSKMGVYNSIIVKKEGNFSCLFCLKDSGEEYCKNFTGVIAENDVCTRFEPIENPFCSCANYDPAVNPSFLKADITGGVSRNFAEKTEKYILACKTPKSAFLKAIAIVDQYKYKPMPIPNNSIDLVTSSMVISQFDVEPYKYFSFLLEKRFGRSELVKYAAKLMPLMEKLRTKLFCLQVESHIKEIYRILKKNKKSRAYFSAELFRSHSDSDSYFLVQDMPKAIEVIGKYFYFEFDNTLGENILKKAELFDGGSINLSYVLIPNAEI